MLLAMITGLLVSAPVSPAAAAVKTIRVDPAARSILMAADASLSGSLKIRWPEPVKRFWVENWTSTRDAFTWTVQTPAAGEYEVSLIVVHCPKEVVGCTEPSSPVEVTLSSSTGRVTHQVKYRDTSPHGQWMREDVHALLRIPAGTSSLTLRATRQPVRGVMNIALLSVELTQPSVMRTLAREASGLRSDASWMTEAKYGLMFTWTTRSQPRHGPQKPYCEAVRVFDVERFAGMVESTGAGFIVFVTTWRTTTFRRRSVRSIESFPAARANGTCPKNWPRPWKSAASSSSSIIIAGTATASGGRILALQTPIRRSFLRTGAPLSEKSVSGTASNWPASGSMTVWLCITRPTHPGAK